MCLQLDREALDLSFSSTCGMSVCHGFTVAGPLLHQHICQGGLASSKEVGETDGFHLDSTAAGVGHAADQLGDAAGVMLQDCI